MSNAVRRLSRDTAIALAAAALLVVAMAIDHLVGTEREPGEEGLADPGAFVLSVVVSLALLGVLFGAVVRRARDAEDAATKAIVLSSLAVLSLTLAFLGLPFAFAGAAIALGLRGRDGERRRLSTSAAVAGALVIALVPIGYVVVLVA